jgi:hypothetical protein
MVEGTIDRFYNLSKPNDCSLQVLHNYCFGEIRFFSLTIKTMNSISVRGGLSATRKTHHNSRKGIRCGIRPLWIFLIIVTILFSSCNEKNSGQDRAELKKEKLQPQDSANAPKVNIKVNKHYDDKGNVVGFDSTYTSFYSNVQGDTARMDSLMHSFDQYFKRDHFFLFNDELNRMFFTDSLRYPDFFHKDFFMKRYELNDHYFRDIMERMDSIKTVFISSEVMQKKRI